MQTCTCPDCENMHGTWGSITNHNISSEGNRIFITLDTTVLSVSRQKQKPVKTSRDKEIIEETERYETEASETQFKRRENPDRETERTKDVRQGEADRSESKRQIKRRKRNTVRKRENTEEDRDRQESIIEKDTEDQKGETDSKIEAERESKIETEGNEIVKPETPRIENTDARESNTRNEINTQETVENTDARESNTRNEVNTPERIENTDVSENNTRTEINTPERIKNRDVKESNTRNENTDVNESNTRTEINTPDGIENRDVSESNTRNETNTPEGIRDTDVRENEKIPDGPGNEEDLSYSNCAKCENYSTGNREPDGRSSSTGSEIHTDVEENSKSETHTRKVKLHPFFKRGPPSSAQTDLYPQPKRVAKSDLRSKMKAKVKTKIKICRGKAVQNSIDSYFLKIESNPVLNPFRHSDPDKIDMTDISVSP